MRHHIVHDSKPVSVNDISDKIVKEIKKLLKEEKFSEENLQKEGIFILDFISDRPVINKLPNGDQSIDKKSLYDAFYALDDSGINDERVSIRNCFREILKNI